jgi:2-polyprenyl-3-methyl-5-hydroxy-6-metoxy-1,4-benzoquinol methylase
MSRIEDRVRKHFDADARRFDRIYEDRKGPISRFIDNRWRAVVRRRLEVNLQELEPLDGKSVLDVGCGSGRFCIAYARRGAARVVGIDFASAMIEIAKSLARADGVSDRCEFVVGRFPDEAVGGEFDASTANGFFDYVEDPTEMVTHMRELTRERLILSFPKAHEWRAPLRRARFRLKGTPLFLYNRKDIERIMADARINNYRWIDLGRDYLIVADLRC